MYESAVLAFVRCGEGAPALRMLEEMTSAGYPPAMEASQVLTKVRVTSQPGLCFPCTRKMRDASPTFPLAFMGSRLDCFDSPWLLKVSQLSILIDQYLI